MARSSKKYWEERGAILEQLSDRRAVITAQRMVPVYQRVLERLNALMEKLFRRYTQGSGITQEKAMELLTQKQTAEMRQSLLDQLAETSDKRLRQEIIATLDAPAYGYRISRLQALRDAAWVSARSIAPVEENVVEARLKDLYEQGYYRTIFDAQQAVGQAFDFDLLPDDRVQAAVEEYWQTEPDAVAKNFSDRVWDNNTQFGEAVRETITEGLLTGQSYREMGAQLQGAVGAVQIGKQIQADGSVKEVATGGGAVYKTMRLVRTEGNRLTGQAKLTALLDAGFEEYQYFALLETGTCKICGALDRKIFPIAQAVVGVNMHPMHPHCRCYVGPARNGKGTMTGTRGARDAQGKGIEVPADMTYQEWYEKYVAKGGKGDILNATDQKAILDYMSSNVAYSLNDALRTGTPLTDRQQEIVRNLDAALDKLPDYEGTVYRSISTEFMDVDQFWAEHQVNKPVRYNAYTSTSKEIYDSSMEIQMVLHVKHGKDISSYNTNEKEVLVPRGLWFYLTQIDGNTIYMEELE